VRHHLQGWWEHQRPVHALLDAGAAVVSIMAVGEFLGYALRSVSGWAADKTRRYWTITFVGYGINLFWHSHDGFGRKLANFLYDRRTREDRTALVWQSTISKDSSVWFKWACSKSTYGITGR
jgi:hypothetical protein